MLSRTEDRRPVADGAWLLRQHQLLIARHVARLGRGLAEDLASEAIVRSLKHPAPDGRHGPWLERLFQNLLVDHLRRHGRARRHAQASAAADGATSDSPEQMAARAQLRGKLAAVWPQLRPEWRQALAASFFDPDRAAEARRSGTRPATVRTRTFRALAVLRQALGLVRGWLPLRPGCDLSPMAAGLLPAAVAVTVLVASEPSVPLPAPAREVAQATGQPPRATPAPPPVRPPTSPPPLRAPAPRASTPAPARRLPADDPPAAVQRFDFSSDDVRGNRQQPDGVDVVGPPGQARHRSLIEIPGSFVGALVRSLDDL